VANYTIQIGEHSKIRLLNLWHEIREEAQVTWNQVNIQIRELKFGLDKESTFLMAKYNQEMFNEDTVSRRYAT
jgi:DNA integrity scanning protein DisA with diadenylate cyclase activity